MIDCKRRYTPSQTNPSIIYRYCDAAAFNEICSNGTLRFSSIESMNDSRELLWGHELFSEIARKWRDDRGGVDEVAFINEIHGLIAFFGYSSHLLAACFSLESDLLSQWRAYSDDGRGFAIGFDVSEIIKDDSTLKALEVMYDLSTQQNEIQNWIDNLFSLYDRNDGNPDWSDDIRPELMGLDFAAYKNPAFKEEREVRLIRELAYSPENSALFVANGPFIRPQIHFRMAKGAPVPFVDHKFPSSSIKRVVIGPKNPSKEIQIKTYLETLFIADVEIGKSEASYR